MLSAFLSGEWSAFTSAGGLILKSASNDSVKRILPTLTPTLCSRGIHSFLFQDFAVCPKRGLLRLPRRWPALPCWRNADAMRENKFAAEPSLKER